MAVEPVLVSVIRNETASPISGEPTVGVTNVLLTLIPGWVVVTLAVVGPAETAALFSSVPVAETEFVVELQAALTVKYTLIVLLLPDAIGPTLLQVRVGVTTLLGVTLADWKLKQLFGNVSFKVTVLSVVGPGLAATTSKRTTSPSTAMPSVGSTRTLLRLRAGLMVLMVAVALETSVPSVGST